MASHKWLFALPALFLLAACGPAARIIEIGGYTFEYRGETYRIESITPNFLEGYNVLSRKDGERLVFKGTDREQDGILDEVTIGDIPLEEARRIYRAGLEAGEEKGYLRMRSFAREFRTRIDHNRFILATYVLALGDIYNKLSVWDLSNQESVVYDMDADGVLDRIEQGSRTLGQFQMLYQLVLKEGMRQKKITLVEGRYLVEL